MDLLAASIIAVLDLLFPIITRTFMKDFIPTVISGCTALAGALVVLYVLRLLASTCDYYGHVVGVNIEYRMRKDSFSHLQTLDFRFSTIPWVT